MPHYCVVPFCSARSSGQRFPKDEQLRQKWIAAIRRDKFKPNKFSRICNKHFVRSDFELSLDSVLKFPVPTLKRDAVPNQFHWTKGTTSTDEQTLEVMMEVESRDFSKLDPVPAIPKRRRRNAFVDTEDDSDTSDEDSRPIERWTRCGKKFIALGSSPFPANQENHLALFKKQKRLAEVSSITRNLERYDHTYSQIDLPATSGPQGPTDKGIRLKNSKDLLQQLTAKQTTDRINEITSQFQANGSLLDMSHFRMVIDQIQNSLNNMSREELVAFCKMKIEEEVIGKVEKIERENQISHLEASLLACKTELSALQTKNTELKFAFSTIYKEYKKGTNHSTQPPLCVFKDAKEPDKPPILLVRLNKRPLGFSLPDNSPKDDFEFITSDDQTEIPEVEIFPLNSETVPEILTTVMQEDHTYDQNCVPEIKQEDLTDNQNYAPEIKQKDRISNQNCVPKILTEIKQKDLIYDQNCVPEIKQEVLTRDQSCVPEILTEIKQEVLTSDQNCVPEILTEIKQEVLTSDHNCVPEILTEIKQEDLAYGQNCVPEIMQEVLTRDQNCVPEILTEIKQEVLTSDQNCVPEILTEIKQEDLSSWSPPSMNPTHNLVISSSHFLDPTPSPLATINGNYNQQQSTTTDTTKTHDIYPTKKRNQIQNDILDIEGRIPHSLITCKSVKNSPAFETSKEFKVLQSIDLTHEQRISEQKAMQKTISNDLNNCFPRIASTQSLALQLKVDRESAKPPVALTNLSNSPVLNNTDIPSIQTSSQVLIPGSFSSNLLDSSGQTILNSAKPMQIAYIINGTPGSQGPQKKYFKTSETGSLMIPQISNVMSLGKSVHGAVKHTNSVGTKVFDLTDVASNNVPNNNSENIPRLVYRFMTSADRNGGLDRKLFKVKKKVLKKVDLAQIPADLKKIALVKISPEEKMTANPAISSPGGDENGVPHIVTINAEVNNDNVSFAKKRLKLPNILKRTPVKIIKKK